MTLSLRPFLPFLAAIAMLAGVLHGADAADLVVIVSARSTAPMLRAGQVAAIFLGQAAQFPDGAAVAAIDQPVGCATREAFYVRVASKTPALLRAYWSRMLFTGHGQPPREVDGDAAVRKLVADTPGLIGYIERTALDASVRPVLVLH
ncbi:phosphate ABC transporter substrate-binding protein [Massilia sp. S19_KUP03_FR1]|uniref:phosphate ABC transporter substrate-binding protein n=1 Tax=Massilia sp. S19_KUP03_FR1 TaxID=3025503 RepID=UPI002FCDDF58